MPNMNRRGQRNEPGNEQEDAQETVHEKWG